MKARKILVLTSLLLFGEIFSYYYFKPTDLEFFFFLWMFIFIGFLVNNVFRVFLNRPGVGGATFAIALVEFIHKKHEDGNGYISLNAVENIIYLAGILINACLYSYI